jgi:hypothetical protein
MIERKRLLDDLQKLVPKIEADLLERSESAEVPEVGDQLRREFEGAKQAERTAQSYSEWRSDQVTQAAAAWVISCVFARFLEDNRLIEPPVISGPDERLKRARDEHELYFRAKPALNDRNYLFGVFDGLSSYPATKEVFGPHNPIRDVSNWLSGDAAGALITFFQRIDSSTGVLVHDFTDSEWDTRFLGDLYQDLSEAARKKYALLQTPVFVEEFILDRTLDPAIEESGLAKLGYESRLEVDGRLAESDRFRMIDPACGSGHFLLGSFAQLLDRWRRKEPGTKVSVLVQRALDSVHGVDLNPYAVAIARFRLLLAAMKECGVSRLRDAPGFEIHVACGDSLLHGSPGGDQLSLGWSSIDHVYQPEDKNVLDRLLRPGRYHAVVANPPYITPNDRALNQAYRDKYSTCHMKYSLAVPFLERIVSLAVNGGFTGQITSNSFMKREFGKKLIEAFFPRVDLTHVIDTSGAYIPGHGTPTVILLVRNQKPFRSTLRTVMGIRGEPTTPDAPASGLVWTAIVAQVDSPGSRSDFVSVGDSHRELFHKHPWSIGGGGAAELKEKIDCSAEKRLIDTVASVGLYQDTHADEAFIQPLDFVSRRSLSNAFRVQVRGENVRDWYCQESEAIFFPYDPMLERWTDVPKTAQWAWLYTLRTELWSRSTFGGGTYRDVGRPWFDYHQFPKDRARTSSSIAFAFVATHNHFMFDRSGRVFNRTAPVIKLPPGSTDGDHLGLLGLLNSSTACFWLQQMCHNKGRPGADSAAADERYEMRYEHDGTKIEGFPVPRHRPVRRAKRLEKLAASRAELLPASITNGPCVTRGDLELAHSAEATARAQMIALQEEIDSAIQT